MNIYTISDDLYFQNGILSLAKIKGWNISAHELDHYLLQSLTFEDIVILHLDAKNSPYAKAISQLNRVSKLLIVLGSSRDILINEADEVIKSRDSLSVISRAINRLIKKQKDMKIRESALSDIENIILTQSLQGKSIHLIAHALNITPKKVYAHRNKACKKLGGKKVCDLLLIRDKLFEESSVFIPSIHNIQSLGWS